MIKKIIIHLFKLNDLKELYIAERQRQQKRDEESFRAKFRAEQDRNEREMDLLKQSHESEIFMIKRELNEYKLREKDLCRREYLVKKVWKKNISNFAALHSRVDSIAQFFTKESGELKEVLDDNETNAKKMLSQ